MRAGLTVGLITLSILATVAPAAAQAPAQEPRMQTAAADAGGPEPMTTDTTVRVGRREAIPAPAPAQARPWCTGRVFGSGAGFCAIN
ncbi:hypothetical protein LRS73_30425 [Methylobacterium currus]|uniref:hypothetical protein n=1 Tax=Methylobacterium currus TaxID=2051553 RepID=UPI001E463688|nr:hypothetical protein [Methylobacterium currus]UHC19208.1 hypothetical protein LRS73_30425 [Methylobacterium currus]